MKTTAIIVAAGTGSRFKSVTPKQFLELAGKPIFVHAIERFASAPSIDSIVVVLAKEYVEEFQHPASKLVAVVAGGSTRAESVMHGLDAAAGADMVAVHDGARPLISSNDVDRTVNRAKETGAACLVAPVTDTIKTIRDEEITGTLDRNKLCRALTPQVFRFEVLRQAFENGELSDAVTDECYLVEQLGYPIATVEATSPNIKITTAADLLIAKALVGEFLEGERRFEENIATRKAATLKPER